MVTEDVWNIEKKDLLVIQYYSPFTILEIKYLDILEQKESI